MSRKSGMDEGPKKTDRIDEALRYGNEHYRALFNAIADGVVVHELREDGSPGRFLEVNSVMCERLGYARTELLQMMPLDIDAPDSGVDVNTISHRVRAGETVTFEHTHAARDGRRIPVEIRAQKFDLDGRQCVLSIVRDIAEQRRVQGALKESEYRLDLALEASGLAVWDYDLVTGGVHLGRHWWPILGYSPGDVPSRVEAWEKLTHPEDLARLKSALAAHMKGVTPTLEVEYRMQAKSGDWRWIRTVGRVVERDADGRASRATGTHGNVTLRKEQEAKIARLTRLHQVISSINSAIVRVRNRDELFKEACRIAAEQGGFGIAWIGGFDPATMDITPVAWSGTDVIGHGQLKTTARSDVPLGHGVVGRAIREKTPVACNDMAAEPNVGSEQRREALRRGYRSDIALPLFEEGAVTGALTLYAREPNFFTDDEITLLRELAGDVSFSLDFIAKEERLDYLAYYDALTGAANRTLLNDRLAQALMQAHRYGNVVAVAVLNLDHFKLVNDGLGHTVGDELLKLCVARIRSCVRETDTLARLGSDEFVLVLSGQSNISAAARVVNRVAEAVSSSPELVPTLDRLLKLISEPLKLAHHELNVTCTIGVSLYPQDGSDPDTLLRNAAAALSRGKQLGRKSYHFYTAELNTRVAQRLALHSALRRALELDEFMLYYQPKVSLQTGRVSGSEALLRWNRAGTGMTPPSEFIPVLEETGLIIDVGRWVMEKAATTYAQWKTQHADAPRIAVNVSQLQLAQNDFVTVVERVLKNGGGGLDIEITESLIMQDIEPNIAKLKALRAMGVQVAIDDFGTGHSALSYLTRLPVDILKIDRAFITAMDTSADSLTLVTSIISLAHSLGLKVVAEGVETAEQVKMLRLLKCDEIQGYMVSRPVPDAEFSERWQTYNANDQPSKQERLP